MRQLIFLLAAPLLAACLGDSSGPSVPDATGMYSIFTSTDLTQDSTAIRLSVSPCAGSLTITDQSGASFSGEFAIPSTSECAAISGSISGTLEPDGEISFSIDVPGATEDFFELWFRACQYVEGDSQFSGVLFENEVEVSRRVTMDCFSPYARPYSVDRFQIEVRISGSPDITVPMAGEVSLRSGTYFGFCSGYCLTELRIDSTSLFYARLSRSPAKYPTITKTGTISDEQWASIVQSIDIDAVAALDSLIGCPDCADGGGEWIELDYYGTKKLIVFEDGARIVEIEALLRQVRTIRLMFRITVL